MYKQVTEIFKKSLGEHDIEYKPGSILLADFTRKVYIGFLGGDVSYRTFLKLTPKGKFYLLLKPSFIIPRDVRILESLDDAVKLSAPDVLRDICKKMDEDFRELHDNFLLKCCGPSDGKFSYNANVEYCKKRGFTPGTYPLSDKINIEFNPFGYHWPITLHFTDTYRNKRCWPWDFKKTLAKELKNDT
jgi:hypothetical protein